MKLSEYQQYDALGLAELVRNREVSAEEVLEASIALTEQNSHLNAVVHNLYDKAREQVKQVPANGAFAGVPCLLKDLGHHLAGTPMALGNAAHRNQISDRSSFMVERMAAAGMVFTGKTNVPEFGLKGISEPQAFGPARNPWDNQRSPGGSSGGSAAMVAAGAVPIATANDGGGSIRIPASYCGLVGLKPSRGMVSNGPQYADIWDGLNTDLVVSRTVRDSAAVLDTVAGNMPGDPYPAPAKHSGFLESLHQPLGKLRIAMHTEPPFAASISPAAIAAVEETARLLADAGHRVEYAAPQLDADALIDTFTTLYLSQASTDYHMVEKAVGKSAAKAGTEAQTRFLAYLGDCIKSADYVAARRTMNTFNRTFGEFFENYDVILTPTVAGVAPLVGSGDPTQQDTLMAKIVPTLGLGKMLMKGNALRESMLQTASRVPYTQLANISGLPAISVPLCTDPETGLPIGSMLTASMGNDGILLQLAAQLEQQRPWQSAYPFHQA